MAKRDIWTQIANLREAAELFIDLPAPDCEAENADHEEDERIIRQQILASVAMAQAALNVLAANAFRLYGDPAQGEPQ